MGGLKIKISAPKLPTIKVPKAIDPSRALKGTVSSLKRSDVGVLTTAVAKGATGQKLSARENKAIQTGAKIGAVAAGGYALYATGAGGAIVGGIKAGAGAVGSYAAANPLSTAVVASQLSQGKTQGAQQLLVDSGASNAVSDNMSQPSFLSDLGNSLGLSGGNPDTIPSLTIANQPGVRATLQNTSTQAPIVKTQSASAPQASNQKILIYGGIGLVVGLILLKKFKVL